MSETRNSKLLESFVTYCKDNPELRFWQALRGWSEYQFVYVSNSEERVGNMLDTFYWEGKGCNQRRDVNDEPQPISRA